jgi:acetyltransferase
VAILADGGGHATIAADLLTDLGIHIPEFANKTQEALRAILPSAASIPNPVDVAGGTDADPSLFADCARIILKDPNVGGLLLVGLFGGYSIRFAASLAMMEEDAAHQMGKMVKKGKKPIIVHSLFASEKPHSLDLLRYYGIPVYDSLDVACKCVGVLAEYGNYLKSHHSKVNFVMKWGSKAKTEGKHIFERARKENRSSLLETEAKKLLGLHGAPVSMNILARTSDEAVDIWKKLECDVALKIVSPDILHKSDIGGVKVKLNSEKMIQNGFSEIIQNAKNSFPKADIRGVLITPMANPGIEVIVGTKIDDQFGPIIMYGLGGIMVEIFKDVVFRVLPITRNGAKKMIEETKSFPILNGVRGTDAYDKKALINLLLLCSELVEAYPEIMEMDLNPVIIHKKGISLVDARILLK